MRILLHWLLSAICLVLVCTFVPGFQVTNMVTAFLAAAVIGLLNATLGVVLKLITLPLGILTLGLFFLVINALMLEFASRLVPGFYVRSFGAAFIGACILAVLHMILGAISGA
jgi:putative membrane protein